MNRARMTRFAVPLCFICVTLSLGLTLTACRSRLTDTPQPKSEALAALLPKPNLPELQAMCGGRSAAGIRGGYVWTQSGDLKQLDEVWPPPHPSGKLLVTPGEKVTFTVTLPPGSSAATARKAGLSAQLSAWDAYVADNREEAAPAYSDICQIVEAGAAKVRLSWPASDALATRSRGNPLVMRLLLRWGDQESSPWVSFYWNMTAVEKGVPEAVLKAARRYFDATWAGDEEPLSKVLPAWMKEQPEDPIRPSPLRARLPGSLESVMWKSATQQFSLASGPSFLVEDMCPSASGSSAKYRVEYDVEVKDVQSKQTQRVAIREEVLLEGAGTGDGDWKVTWASRKPAPAELAIPEIAVRDEEFGSVVRVGPFEGVRSYWGQKWSDDGEWFAFLGSASAVNGVWAASRDGSKLVDLVGLKGTGVQLLNWAPGQHRVRFLSYGYHSSGPHADKTGYWVAEVDLDTQEVRDIVFIRYPRLSFPKDVAVPEGGRYVVFKHTPDLWRVDMETGEVAKIADDIPSWDGLLALQYSPSRRYAAYSEPYGSSLPGFTVYDVETGEKRYVDLSGVTRGDLWARFTTWTPNDELMVLVCGSDEINHGEDSSYPAAATAIHLYSPAGALVHEILPPSDDRIGPAAWNADGSALALTVGDLGEPVMNVPYGLPERRHQSRAVYVWSRSDGALRKVTDISGEIESLAWGEDGRTIEAWFRVSDDWDVKIQNGARIGLDGSRLEIQRPVPYRARQGDVTKGSLGDLTLVERLLPEGGTNLLVRGEAGAGSASETVVNDVGPLRFGEPAMAPGAEAAAISGEVPDTYGEGPHWVYLVVRSE